MIPSFYQRNRNKMMRYLMKLVMKKRKRKRKGNPKRLEVALL